jgi:glycine/D-amino acid oxidase-like deaminating enzyme
MDVVIVGAGTFGASLAWWLARDGERVTLVDQFEPGDGRATSGGETRLIRCSHGADADYTAMARPAERLAVADAARLYPSFRGDDLAFVLLEPEAGVVRAQRAVRALAARAAAHGARIERARARPDGRAAVLDDGSRLEGDAVVWACGGWLAPLFGDLVSLAVTRQELLFLDGGDAWRAPGVPGWVDYDRAMYGTADLDGLGVKAALDVEGPPLGPDAPLGDAADTEPQVRAYLRDRFPALERAPLAEVRACRYELSPDSHFIAARHPEHDGVWLIGGGSGHGFKHGPAMAERLAAALAGGAPLPARFGLGERLPARSFRTAGSGVVI